MINRRYFNFLAAAAIPALAAKTAQAHDACADGEATNIGDAEDQLLFRDFLMEELGLSGVNGHDAGGPKKTPDGGVAFTRLSNLAGFSRDNAEEAFLDFEETRDYAFSKEAITNLLRGTPDYGEIGETFEWPEFNRSVDTHHLREYGEPELGAEFDITPRLLEQLAASNHFDLDYHFDGAPNPFPTLFTFRGCRLVDTFQADSPWQDGVRVSYDRPVHASIRQTPGAIHAENFYNRRACVFGAWDRKNNKVTVVEANSIPTQDFARRTIQGTSEKILNSSVLPSGYYRYYFGLMGNGKQAFRKEKHDYIVLRSPFDVGFDPFDTKDEFGDLLNTSIWTTGRYHHIHDTAYGTGYGAGCTIVNRKDGAWEGFLNALRRIDGLGGLPKKGVAGSYTAPGGSAYRFNGMLLSGAEAALLALEGDTFAKDYSRLRIGSGGRRYGDTVKKFQHFARTEAVRLRINATVFNRLGHDGKFGKNTGIASLILNRAWQKKAGDLIFDHSAPIIEARYIP